MKTAPKFILSSIAAMPLLAAGTASAAWEPVATFDPFDAYIDRATVTRDGSLHRVWLLYDFRKPTAFDPGARKFRSAKSLVEFDCRAQRGRTLWSNAYEDTMARGSQVGSGRGEPDLRPVPATSAIGYAMSLTCPATAPGAAAPAGPGLRPRQEASPRPALSAAVAAGRRA